MAGIIITMIMVLTIAMVLWWLALSNRILRLQPVCPAPAVLLATIGAVIRLVVQTIAFVILTNNSDSLNAILLNLKTTLKIIFHFSFAFLPFALCFLLLTYAHHPCHYPRIIRRSLYAHLALEGKRTARTD